MRVRDQRGSAAPAGQSEGGASVDRRSQRGVTLLELMIAITLVAALSAGMLMAMRTSLDAYEKTSKRLEANRRVVKIQQILTDQLSGMMAIPLQCADLSNPSTAGSDASSAAAPSVPRVSFMAGQQDRLRFVSSYSIAEGARGYPQIVEYRVNAAPNGEAQLIVTERNYTGPASAAAYCNTDWPPPSPGMQTLVLADHLALLRFSYHPPYDLNTFLESPWQPLWDKPALPAAIRIELSSAMADPGGLPLLSVTVPIRANRDPQLRYYDGF
jgi:prepilin-type N-terminal cleavage/methylation domain-containing protein